MAVGDIAAAGGFPVVPSTKKLNLGYSDINALADATVSARDSTNGRVTTLEAATNIIIGNPTIAGGKSDLGGTNAIRVGRLVVVNMRVVKPQGQSYAGNELIMTLPSGFRPIGRIGVTGFINGTGALPAFVEFNLDGTVYVYPSQGGANYEQLTASITFVAA